MRWERRTRTNGEGDFTFDDVPSEADRIRIRIDESPPGYVEAQGFYVLPEGSGTRIVFRRCTKLLGRVLPPPGMEWAAHGLGDLRIIAQWRPGSIAEEFLESASVREDGTFGVRVPVGVEVAVWVDDRDLQSAGLTCSPVWVRTARQDTAVEVPLERGLTIAGTVTCSGMSSGSEFDLCLEDEMTPFFVLPAVQELALEPPCSFEFRGLRPGEYTLVLIRDKKRVYCLPHWAGLVGLRRGIPAGATDVNLRAFTDGFHVPLEVQGCAGGERLCVCASTGDWVVFVGEATADAVERVAKTSISLPSRSLSYDVVVRGLESSRIGHAVVKDGARALTMTIADGCTLRGSVSGIGPERALVTARVSGFSWKAHSIGGQFEFRGLPAGDLDVIAWCRDLATQKHDPGVLPTTYREVGRVRGVTCGAAEVNITVPVR